MRITRRQLCRGAAAVLVPGGAVPAFADAGAPMLLLAAGPAGQAVSRWGDACALAMAQNFPGAPMITAEAVGGLDGVTGANRLDALVVPDGQTAAILPGAAMIAWLTGDTRVHFDPTRWVPVMAACGSGVLVARLPPEPQPDLARLRALAPLRLAADGPQSNDLAALLALARLAVPVAPVFGLRDTVAKTQAFAAQQVDAVFLCGEGVTEDVAALRAAGGVPVFSIGVLDADGTALPDPQFPDLPDVSVFSGGSTPFLDAAYHAAAAAARLDFIVVLPKLTDPSAVALWRQAAMGAAMSPALMAAAQASAVTLAPAAVAEAALNILNLVAPEQTSLQAYLARNYGWQPG